MSTEDEPLGDLLHGVVMLLGMVAREQPYSRDGLSHSRMRLLGTLEEIQPATQHQLAQAMFVSDAAVSRMLKQLEPDGLVQITTDPDHARRRLVRLTRHGRRRFHAISAGYGAHFEQALRDAGFPYDRYLDDTMRLRDFLLRRLNKPSAS